MTFQGIVFFYAFFLVSAKMSFDGFGIAAQQPLAHSKKFSSIHEQHSQSQSYVFSSQSSSSFSKTKSEQNAKKAEHTDSLDAIYAQEALKTNEENTKNTDKNSFTNPFPELTSGHEKNENNSKQNNETSACNTATEKKLNKKETNKSENTTSNATIQNSNYDETNATEISHTESNSRKSDLNKTSEIDKEFVKKTGSEVTDKNEEVENTTEATTTTEEFQKANIETVQMTEMRETQYENAPKTVTKKSVTVAEASVKSATPRETNAGNAEKKKNAGGQESTTSENTNHTIPEATDTKSHDVAAADSIKTNQPTTIKASNGKISTQSESNTDNTKKVTAEGNQQTTAKPAESEATLTNSNKDKRQNVYDPADEDTKSIFTKREEEHQKGRYDFKQMDGVKAIHNAIQMDLNFKTLLVEDGSVPGKCYCSCDMNSQPVFIAMDSESIPS